MAGVRAARRDASFYDSRRFNDSRGMPYVPKYHVVHENGNGPCCNPDNVLLTVDNVWRGSSTECDAVDVSPAERCQRPGCRGRWPA